MNHCVRYSVDPNLIGLVPIERLPKSNVRVFNPFAEHKEDAFRGRVSPPSPTTTPPIPVKDERPEWEVTSADYNQIMQQRPIALDEEMRRHKGKRVKIINKTTGSFVVRTLKLIGNKGYFV